MEKSLKTLLKDSLIVFNQSIFSWSGIYFLILLSLLFLVTNYGVSISYFFIEFPVKFFAGMLLFVVMLAVALPPVSTIIAFGVGIIAIEVFVCCLKFLFFEVLIFRNKTLKKPLKGFFNGKTSELAISVLYSFYLFVFIGFVYGMFYLMYKELGLIPLIVTFIILLPVEYMLFFSLICNNGIIDVVESFTLGIKKYFKIFVYVLFLIGINFIIIYLANLTGWKIFVLTIGFFTVMYSLCFGTVFYLDLTTAKTEPGKTHNSTVKNADINIDTYDSF